MTAKVTGFTPTMVRLLVIDGDRDFIRNGTDMKARPENCWVLDRKKEKKKKPLHNNTRYARITPSQ